MIVQMSKISIGHISERKGVFRRLQQPGLFSLKNIVWTPAKEESRLQLTMLPKISLKRGKACKCKECTDF